MASIRSARRVVRAHGPLPSRRVLVAAVVAVLGVLLPGTASAQAARGTVVVEGLGGSTTEWVLEGEMPVHVNWSFPVSLTGGGPYAGALFEPVDVRSSPLGAVQVRAFGDQTREAVAKLGVQLSPGRYRVTVFGNGPVRVVLPNNDREAPGIRISTRTRIPVAFFGRSEDLAAGYDSARIDLTGALPAGKRALQLNLENGTRVGRFQTCATADTECERPLLPFCLPSPAPCELATTRGPEPGVSSGSPRAGAGLVRPEAVPRRLLWSFDGYRDSPGKLRAAAIVF